MARKASKKPVVGACDGPDKKGRFHLKLPSSERSLYFYGGVPGEVVEVRRGRRSRKGEQGDLLRVHQSVPERREAACLHFGVCGGCTLQHIPEDLALELKTREHYDTLRAYFPEALFFPPVPSPQSYAYRGKVELTFMQGAKGQVQLGFHKRGRFDKAVDLSSCALSPFPASLLRALRSWAEANSLKAWSPRQNVGDLRYLIYRFSSTQRRDLVALVVNTETEISQQAREALIDCLQSNRVNGALIVRQSSVAGAVVADSTEVLFGEQHLVERLGDLEFRLAWESFFQVNPRAYESLLQRMREWRIQAPGAKLLDLFCGVGTIGLSVYEKGDRLLGVEVVAKAVEDARQNALLNNIPAEFEHRAAEVFSNLQCDLLVLDPPRSGCHPKLLKVLRQGAVSEELFYISCNPHRLKEELEDISQSYELIRAQAFDFFPQTHHAEFLLHFRKKS